ncbi:MAG: zinc metallopeptidase [Alistipes sp.]|nr:zinc metallopeptidase [Alistipes sp.]
MFLTTLVTDYAGENQAIMTNLTTSEAFLMVIIVGVVGMIVQWRLRSVVSKYSQEPLPAGFTGAAIARRMLDAYGIHNVSIVHTGGYLTDHFNPATMTVNLSDEVYNGRSITAAAIACHECGHAVQHAQGYAPLRMRSALVPLVNFSSQAASWLIIIGLIMTASSGSQLMCWIGVGLMCVSALFSIITLPVEYNASDRALEWLESSRILVGEELEGARISLRWAARTYLVAALSAIASILYYVALINGRRRD